MDGCRCAGQPRRATADFVGTERSVSGARDGAASSADARLVAALAGTASRQRVASYGSVARRRRYQSLNPIEEIA